MEHLTSEKITSHYHSYIQNSKTLVKGNINKTTAKINANTETLCNEIFSR